MLAFYMRKHQQQPDRDIVARWREAAPQAEQALDQGCGLIESLLMDRLTQLLQPRQQRGFTGREGLFFRQIKQPLTPFR